MVKGATARSATLKSQKTEQDETSTAEGYICLLPVFALLLSELTNIHVAEQHKALLKCFSLLENKLLC